ncbi:FAD-binding protein [Moorella naiadis]|uniref:FAD-binding protein n=1 Tax=Moorella naiadis (nom. illeg.) TaxID=3093670 RepID=UPI003D9CAC6C
MSSIDNLADEIIICDVLIVGSEGAGARAALQAAKKGLRVVVACKGVVGKSGATLTADADIDVDSKSCVEKFGLPGDLRDNPDKFAEDMIREAEFINNQYLVKIHCEEAPDRVREVVDMGARVDKLTHAPGHSYPRGIWIPGTEFARVGSAEMRKRDNIRLLQYIMITDFLTQDGRVVGACGLNIASGQFYAFKAKAVIICAGGAMRVYPHTTAPEDLTGDCLAAAYRVGAELIDMEFPMFLPYTLIKPDSLDGVDFTYLLSAYLETHALNRIGERYMKRWDPERMEHSTRDVNSIAAMVEVLEGRGSPNNGTYLSLRHLPKNILDYSAEWFPENISNWRYGGFNMKKFLPDLSQEAMETAPAAHFWNGGIKINERCETNIPGLYAAGEGTGSIMGANRISGNALTMTQVWGYRAGTYAAEYVAGVGEGKIDMDQVAAIKQRLFASLEAKKGEDVVKLRKELQDIAWMNVGVVRDQEGLEKGLKRIAVLREKLPTVCVTTKARAYNKEWIEAIQLENLSVVLEMVARSSLSRQESRGALYRRDFPKTDNVNWLKNVVIYKNEHGMAQRIEDVDLAYIQPKRVIRDYGQKG